jgi:hypothetical protein
VKVATRDKILGINQLLVLLRVSIQEVQWSKGRLASVVEMLCQFDIDPCSHYPLLGVQIHLRFLTLTKLMKDSLPIKHSSLSYYSHSRTSLTFLPINSQTSERVTFMAFQISFSLRKVSERRVIAGFR